VRRVIQASLLVAGLIHFLPITGVLGADRLTSMYAIPFTDPNLAILMRHRAIMLGLLGGFVLYAVFRPAMRVPAIALGGVSLASIVALAWSTGGYNEALARVILADSIAVACFLVAAALTVVDRRGRKG
jgi:hypothetical protein